MPTNNQTMKKLLKDYGFNSDMQYFEMIVESIINGQRTQAKEQFKAMSREYRKQFIKACTDDWNTGLSRSDIAMLIDII